MFKIITIPFDSDTKTFHEDVLNKSILNKKIKSYHVKFFQDGENSYWSVFLEYSLVPTLQRGNAYGMALFPRRSVGTRREGVGMHTGLK